MKTSIITAALAALALLALNACTVSTLPDGTQVKEVNQEALNPFLELARDLFLEPQPPVAPIVLDNLSAK